MPSVADVARYHECEARLWQRFVGAMPTERYIDLPSLGTRVRTLIHGNGPTLLFIHGGPSACSKFAPLVRHLGDFRCVLLERPGCGLSAPASRGPRGVCAYAQHMVQDALDALDLAKATVVASSFGSYCALAFASAAPKRVERVVHLGAPPLVPGARIPLPFLLSSLPLIGTLVRAAQRPSYERSQRAFVRMGHMPELLRTPDFVAFLEWYTALMLHTDTRSNDATLFGRVRPNDAINSAELARITAPSLFVRGARDSFGTGDSGRALAGMLPQGRCELLPDCGHLPWLDDARRVSGMVRSFVS